MLRPFGQSEKSGCLKIARRTALEPVEAGDALDITSKQPVAKSVAHQPTTTTELRSAGTARKWPTTLETVHSVITRRIGRIRSIKKTERFVLPDRQLEPVIVQAAYATRMPHSDEEIVPWPGSNVQSIIAPLTHEASLARQDLLLYQLKNSINRLAALHGPYSDAVATELQLATSLRAFLQAVNSLRELDNCDKLFKAQLEKRAARHVVCREMRSHSKQTHPVKRIWANRAWEHGKRRHRCHIYTEACCKSSISGAGTATSKPWHSRNRQRQLQGSGL